MNSPLKEQVAQTSAWIKTLREEIAHVIVGQEHLVERLLVGLLANGHVLLEGDLPDAGLVTVEDAETGELLELASGRSSVREQYSSVNAMRLAELDRSLNRTGVDTLRLKTTEPFAPVLQRFFELRRGRRRG